MRRSYFAIIEGKTAELTAVSCRLGAHYAGADETTTEALDRYGRNLGIAFQIADDVLDIWGEERLTGKSLGTDLEKQKLTLPVIRLLETADPATGGQSAECSAKPGRNAASSSIPLLEESGALDYSWQRARWHVKEAVDALECLGDSEAKVVLRVLADYTVRRAS